MRTKYGPHKFRVANVPPGIYELRCRAQGFKPVMLTAVRAPSDDTHIELKYIGEPTHPGLKGVVVAAGTNTPVTAFRLRTGRAYGPDASAWREFSNGAGEFYLEDVGREPCRVQVAADGFGWALSEVILIRIGEPKQMPLRIELSEGVTLGGRVADERGMPVSGAKVIPFEVAPTAESGRLVQFAPELGTVETVDGSFTLRDVPRNLASIKVTHPEYVSSLVEDIPWGAGKSGDDFTITLTPGATVRGRVYDADGNPEPGVALRYSTGAWSRFPVDNTEVTTDDAGYYEAKHLAEGIVFVKKVTPERMPFWTSLGVVSRAVAATNGAITTLDFGGATYISGRLVVDGSPLAYQTVMLSSGSGLHSGCFHARATTSDNGAFSFAGVPQGDYSLYFRLPWQRPMAARFTTFRSTGGDMDLGTIAYATPRLSVTLVADEDADSPAEARLELMEHHSMRHGPRVGRMLPRSALSEPAVFEHVPPGTYQLLAHRPNSPMIRRLVEMPADQTDAAIELRLPTGTAQISGRLSEVDDKMLGRRLSIWNADQSVIADIGRLDRDRYEVENLPAGDYFFADGIWRYGTVPFAEVSLEEGEAKIFDLDEAVVADAAAFLEHMGSQSVVIVTDDGIPLPGAEVHLVGEEGRREAVFSHDGFHLFRSEVGEYTLHVSYPGFAEIQQQVGLKSSAGPYSQENPQMIVRLVAENEDP
jgi:hypothetical protein